MSSHMPKNTVKVWDMFIRVFHWSLVVSFVVTYFTGDDENQWHIYFGYAIAALLAFRLLWGFIGSKYARFSDFTYSPIKVSEYLKSLNSSDPKHYLGHNPAGGYMVFSLLIMLAITTITGLKVYGVEGHGPLAGNVNISFISEAVADDRDEHRFENEEEKEHEGEENKEEEFWEELHELAANLTVFLILLHIVGVVVSSRLHGENLIKAMLTGRKQADIRKE